MIDMTKEQIVAAYAQTPGDTGSAAVQIALVTQRILHLTQHCKIHKKDFSTRRGLQRLVALRRRLLAYVQDKNKKQHRSLIESLGLRG
jgi:small subunit ribosomal protein S15